jgi:hypothetical protein
MPQKYLGLQEQQIVQRLRHNTLAAGFCTLTGFSLLIPAFSVEGTKFDYQTFCFQPKIIYFTEHYYCTGSKIRRGIAWRVALEGANNQEFKDKVTLLKFLPAQNPHAGLYGLGSAAFFSAAFLLFSHGTEQLEANLDLVVGNKKALIQECSLEQMKHLSIQTLKTQQEEGFLKEAMNLGGVEGMSEAIKEGTIRLKLKANGFQQPLFKGELSGWTDNEGNDINDKPVTLPPWFRPDKLVQMVQRA